MDVKNYVSIVRLDVRRQKLSAEALDRAALKNTGVRGKGNRRIVFYETNDH
jgi:hypothetical protein